MSVGYVGRIRRGPVTPYKSYFFLDLTRDKNLKFLCVRLYLEFRVDGRLNRTYNSFGGTGFS